MLGKALSLVTATYQEKRDKRGELMFFHCYTVMDAVKKAGFSEDVQCAAIMHDLVEDYGDTWTLARLREEGFSERVVELVDLLTHREEDSYIDYIGRICGDKEAIRIKMADLTHNSDINRMQGVRLKDQLRTIKYSLSFHTLERALMVHSRLEVDKLISDLQSMYNSAVERMQSNDRAIYGSTSLSMSA